MLKLARTITERLSRGRSLVRSLPPQYGHHSLVVSPDAALRWLRPSSQAFEAELLCAVDALVRPGDVVWDLGANVGAFGVPAAIRSGTTTLFVEADAFLAELLRRTAAHRSNAKLDLRVLEFAIAGRGRASSGLVQGALSTQHGSTRQRLLVPGLRADSLLANQPAPAVVKADLEGAEHLFLQGADTLIDRIKPTLYLEIYSSLRPVIYPRLERSGYLLCELDGTRIKPINGEQKSDNLVALPPERHADAAN